MGVVPISATTPPAPAPLDDWSYDPDDLELDLRWWAAANYLTVGQIYLRENPLLREPLSARAHQAAAARPLGHQPRPVDDLRPAQPGHPRDRHATGSTSPGPGTAGRHSSPPPGSRAPTPRSTPTSATTPTASARCSGSSPRPAGCPATSACRRPAASTRAASSATRSCTPAGAAFDHPDLIVACVVGDGEAETGPLSASWRLPAFLNPRRDGAVLPILHLNGYKIAGPTVLGRTSDEDVDGLPARPGLGPGRRRRRRPARGVPGAVRRPARRARPDPVDAGRGPRPAGPARRPSRRGRPSCCARPRAGPARTSSTASRSQGTYRGPPGAAVGTRREPRAPADARGVAAVLRARDACSTTHGRLVPELRALAPEGDQRMSATPYANGGRLREELPVLDLDEVRGGGRRAGPQPRSSNTFSSGELMRDLYAATARPDGGGTFRLFSPGRDGQQPAAGRLRGDRPLLHGPGARRPTTTSAPTAG